MKHDKNISTSLSLAKEKCKTHKVVNG